MTDPLIYPTAGERMPFTGPVRVDGGTCYIAGPVEANGEAVGPSFPGNETHYAEGQTVRVRLLGIDPPTPEADGTAQ